MSGLFGNASKFALFWNLTDTSDSEEDQDELIEAGIDPEALEYMSLNERREILQGAGLDPDEYDF